MRHHLKILKRLLKNNTSSSQGQNVNTINQGKKIMSDMRFIIAGIVLIFVGFLILGGFGHNFQAATLESNEFGTCYKYSDDSPPVEINCSFKIFDQTVFFGLVLGFIAAGVISLIKGVRGDWDNRVKPEDMVGPGNNQNDNTDKD